jgi:hypothetical protein
LISATTDSIAVGKNSPCRRTGRADMLKPMHETVARLDFECVVAVKIGSAARRPFMRRDIADPNQKLNRGDQCPRFGIDDVSRALATIAKATTDLSGSCLQTSCSRARGREQAGGNDYPTRLSASETLGSTPSQVIALCGLLTRRRTGVVAVWPKDRASRRQRSEHTATVVR